MSKAFGDGWTSTELPVESLRLDVNNPRLNLKVDASQDQIRKALFSTEDIFQLVNQINDRQGLLAGERLIVTKENGNYVVLEGNRRATAIQVMLKPSLLTKEQQKQLPKSSREFKQRIREVPVDIAPDRRSAEPILTKRHTERGAKPWSTLANMRRVFRYFEGGTSIDDICEILAISKARATQLVRGYQLFQLAQAAPGWKPEEKKHLSDPKLVTSAFTRFFTLKDARVTLGLGYDGEQKATSTAGKSELTKNVALIARRFFFDKDSVTGKPAFDTRSTPDDVFHGRRRGARLPKTGGGNAVQTPKASKFFEKIDCKANDDTLIKLCRELRLVDPKYMPIAASMLLRQVFECALVYQIKKKRLWTALVQKKNGRDPTLSESMAFAGDLKNSVFHENRVADMLRSNTATDAKHYLDTVTHGRWTDADPGKLVMIGNGIRKVIFAIVEDSQ